MILSAKEENVCLTLMIIIIIVFVRHVQCDVCL